MGDDRTNEINARDATRPNAWIRVRGARVHNLRNVDVDIPHGRLTVLTGVSGSGKSSLAFDTLFAEGQRRYLDCLAAGTRSNLATLPVADVDSIDGLSPTVCVDQNVRTATKRSTLATSTEIHDFLRLLYARAGTAHCPDCNAEIGRQTVDQIVERVLDLSERSRLMLLAPMVRDRRGSHKEVLEKIERAGYVRARIDGELVDISDSPALAAARPHSIEAVIDRIILKDGIEPRLRDSVNAAVRESDGLCIVSVQDDSRDWSDTVFSTKLVCPNCDVSFLPLEPRSFSFNSPWGACRACDGLGIEGAAQIADENDDMITTFVTKPCVVCGGSRLQPFASHVVFGGLRIAEFAALSVSAAARVVADWISELNGHPGTAGVLQAGDMPPDRREVAHRTLPDIAFRLQCLQDVGVGYLSLDRFTRTLSGGEFQRARLAASLGTGLHGACFVLDEPTSGLHPQDTSRLIRLISGLRDRGTVVVVEHDPDVVRAADHVIDLGPGAGADGGRVIFSGTPGDLADCDASATGRMLRDRLLPGESPFSASTTDSVEWMSPLIEECPTPSIRIRGAKIHNLKNVAVNFPTGLLTCVTGLSGSGKSSLVVDTLLPLLKASLAGRELATVLADVRCDGIEIPAIVSRVAALDQSPVSKATRSCVATVSGVWNDIRGLFAKTKLSRTRGFNSGRFSFNAGNGRCPDCKGTGTRRIEMKMLPRVAVVCPTCRGDRFNRMTLTVRFQELSVTDVLRMTVREACEAFRDVERIVRVLQVFDDVGVGYLPLGQSAATFSGGESQRVRLAATLANTPGDQTVFLLDEPTSGLHAADIQRLLNVLRGLVDQGHSVIVIEHNLQVVRASDWIVDLGPGAGEDAGQMCSSASFETFVRDGCGATAVALRHG